MILLLGDVWTLRLRYKHNLIWATSYFYQNIIM